MDGYLKELLDAFKDAVTRKNVSVVIIADGKSGMGKTTILNQCGIYLDPNYNLEKIYYEPKSFLEGLAAAKQGDFLLFDEAMLISNRSALSEINKMVIIAMSMIRSKRIFVAFAVNSLFDLDRNLSLHRADLLIHVYSGESQFDRGRFCAFFRAKDGIDRLKILYLYGKKFYDYSKPQANFYGVFPDYFVIDPLEYERRKQKSINDFLYGRERILKSQKSRNRLIRWIYDKNFADKNELSLISGLQLRQIYNILRDRGFGSQEEAIL